LLSAFEFRSRFSGAWQCLAAGEELLHCNHEFYYVGKLLTLLGIVILKMQNLGLEVPHFGRI